MEVELRFTQAADEEGMDDEPASPGSQRQPAAGREQVQLGGDNYLHLREIEVYTPA